MNIANCPKFLLLFLSLFLHLPLAAESRVEFEYVDEYNGAFQSAYEELRWDLPHKIRQTTIDMSTRLGLSYQEGWRYPLRIRFTDKAANGAENLFAYVALYRTDKGEFLQQMFINLAAYDKYKFDYEQVLAHELVHAMMNDSVGGQAAAVLPRWLHEGLAVYGAEEGEKLVRVYTQRYYGFAKDKILNGLDGAHGALDYAEDYLAVKYIVETHGPNALPLFVGEIVKREGDVKAAYEYTTNESWDDFLRRSREFSVEEIDEIKPPRRGKDENPY